MLGVFIVPTGIGAEIGGHSGDATPSAKLIAAACDKLIVHPNVVNASDINEMTENMLYVEGSVLDKFLEGKVGLEEVRSNNILLVTNPPLGNELVNAASAARAVMGAEIQILVLQKPLIMKAEVKNGIATGTIENWEELIKEVEGIYFDVLVVSSPIQTDDDKVKQYLENDGGVNIWGGIEAKLSKLISSRLSKPVFHAPIENSEFFKKYNEIVDPRKSAEMISMCYIHCCLKGAHKSPRMTMSSHYGYWNTDVDFLVTPAQVWGPPHTACFENHIPIIAVLENETILSDSMPESVIRVRNYHEAAGVILGMKQGLSLESVRRPLKATEIL